MKKLLLVVLLLVLACLFLIGCDNLVYVGMDEHEYRHYFIGVLFDGGDTSPKINMERDSPFPVDSVCLAQNAEMIGTDWIK